MLHLFDVVQQEIPWLFALIGGVFGGVLGSFLNCLRYRVPRQLSLRKPPSQCDACGYILTMRDLVPVLSWVWLRGRCRTCNSAIGSSSVVLEMVLVLAGSILFFHMTFFVAVGIGLLSSMILVIIVPKIWPISQDKSKVL